MPRIISIRERLTHRYVDSYSHHDQWAMQAMTFKELAPVQVSEGNGYDDAGSYRVRVIGSKKLNQDKQATVLRQNMSYSGCTHEYDCCGCHSSHATVTKVAKGVFSVLVSMSRNY